MPERVHILFDSADDREREPRPWSADFVCALAADERVVAHSLHRLRPACDQFLAAADWLIELELAPGARVSSVVSEPVCAAALADLRQLRMHPRAQLLEPR